MDKEQRRATNRDIGREPTWGEKLKGKGGGMMGGKNVADAKERQGTSKLSVEIDKDITKRAKGYRLKRLIRSAGKAQQDDSSKHQ